VQKKGGVVPSQGQMRVSQTPRVWEGLRKRKIIEGEEERGEDFMKKKHVTYSKPTSDLNAMVRRTNWEREGPEL